MIKWFHCFRDTKVEGGTSRPVSQGTQGGWGGAGGVYRTCWGLGKNSFVEFEQTKEELIKTNRPHTKYFRSIILNTNLEKKIIPYLHSIPQNFFHKVSNVKKFEDYEFDFNVPGSLGAYPNRRKAQEILLKTNDKRYF